MNYILNIQLEGAEGMQSALQGISGQSEKTIKSFSILDAWGKSVFKGISDDVKAMNWFDSAVKRASQSSDNLLKKWREGLPAPKIHMSGAGGDGIDPTSIFQQQASAFGVGGTATQPMQELKAVGDEKEKQRRRDEYADRVRKSREADEKRSRNDLKTFIKDSTFLMMPMFNPGSVWATLFSSRQTFSALNTEHGQSMLSKFSGGKLKGLSGAAVGTGLLVAGSTAVGLALMALKKTVDEVFKSFESARQLYAKALTGGMGLQFTARRSMLAQIIGVSETDVMRFGVQMAYLNPKLDNATRILAKTTPNLTSVAWEFQVLGYDLKAMFSTMANDGAPAIRNLTNALDGLVKSATWLYEHAPKNTAAGIASGVSNAAFGFTPTLLAKLGIKAAGIFDSGSAPNPQAWMKQLPASHWEKMGLVTMGSNQNYAKDTARNTKEIAAGIKQLVANAKRFGGGKTNWGMSPNVAQP